VARGRSKGWLQTVHSKVGMAREDSLLTGRDQGHAQAVPHRAAKLTAA
jgi:hypothetical protein